MDKDKELKLYNLRREIAHSMIHRMTLLQLIFKGGFWMREYRHCCEKIIKIHERKEKKDASE